MEQKRREELGLLDYLANEVKCMALSDMRQTVWWPGILRVLERTDPLRYGLYEWRETISYITGCEGNFSTVKQAKDFLMQQLKQLSQA